MLSTLKLNRVLHGVSAPYIAFAALWLISSATFSRPLFSTLAKAWNDDEFTHILLILPMSAVLIIHEWGMRSLKPLPNASAGLPLLLAGLGIIASAIWANRFLVPDVRLALSMFALVILWVSAFVLCFGTKAASALLFPLCFLLWMVPIPSFVLVRVVHLLQQGSALSASLLFSAFGVPTSQDGVLLYIPGLNIEVARECSSIRSSLMLLVTTMVLAHSLLQALWRKATVVLLALPLSVAKNGLRIFTIGILGTRIDRGFLTGRLHREGGIVFFLVALTAILIAITFLRRSEKTALMPRVTPRMAGQAS